MSSYNRRFTLSSCHFNDAHAYRMLDSARHARDDPQGDKQEMARAYEAALREIHGHDFAVEIDVYVPPGEWDGTSTLVDDEFLASLVREYDRTNLSVHPDFHDIGARAYTEVIARLIAEKVHAYTSRAVTVKVRETADITAAHTIR